ncbi:MAG: hypothetical protein GF411_11225 [Candidatus Lokiarchaeota archaeon]|nr:hypothetical protein [Candidatus Lokiarchaeota archaeon]
MTELLPDRIRGIVLERITPTEIEIQTQKDTIQKVRNALIERGNEIGVSYEFIEAEGSTGKKQTQIRGAADLDIFIGLVKSDYEEILNSPNEDIDRNLSKTIDELVNKWFRPAAETIRASDIKKTYAQHPYLSFKLNNLEVDLVACFALSPKELATDGPITAVDRTYHHTKYMLEHIDEKIRENIRILKAFSKASHAYGDTCAVGRMGFTGYVLENIVVENRTFSQALDAICTLSDNPIDPLNRSKKELKKIPRFSDDLFFVIDPTDPNRNAAASLSPRTYRWMVISSNRLLDAIRHDEEDFVIRQILYTDIPTNPLPSWIKSHIITFEFEKIKDTHYTIIRDKLYSLAELTQRWLTKEKTGEERFGTTLCEVHFRENRYALGIVVENPKISDYFERRGPPTNLEDACARFKAAHPDAFEREGFLWVSQKRNHTNAQEFTHWILSKKGIDDIELARNITVLSAELKTVLYHYVMPAESFVIEPEENNVYLQE